MPHGSLLGSSRSTEVSEQKEYTSMQMQSRSNVPQSKSRGQYEGTTLRYVEDKHFRSGGGSRSVDGSRLDTWMEYPPNFKKNVLRRAQVWNLFSTPFFR
jgi:hypothetical protein